MSELLSGLAGAVIVFVLQEWRKNRLAPSLHLDAKRGKPWVATRSALSPTGNRTNAQFLRVRVENTGGSTAKACKLFVRAFYAPGQTTNLLDNPVQLMWAGQIGPHFDLPPKLPTFADVIVGYAGTSWPFAASDLAADDQLQSLMREHAGNNDAQPEMDIIVVGDGADPFCERVKFSWGGSWESLTWR